MLVPIVFLTDKQNSHELNGEIITKQNVACARMKSEAPWPSIESEMVTGFQCL